MCRIINKDYIFDPEKLFISSDFHFGHTNILKYDNRPFKDIRNHDEQLIYNHNKLVSNDDDFIFLGDFSMTNIEKSMYLMSRLNGNKFFIKGNHDNHAKIDIYKKFGTYLGEQKEIYVGDSKSNSKLVVLNHFSLRVWNKSHHGSYHLYGHSHGSLPSFGRSMDVGIMNNNYFPFSWKDIDKNLSKVKIKEVDHHKSR